MKELASLDTATLCRVLAARNPAPSSLGPQQWRGVVEILTHRLTIEPDVPERVSWETCSSALVYALDASVAVGDMDRRERTTRLLNLSALLLKRVEPKDGVVLLDPAHLLALFFEEVPIAVDEARALAPHWRDLDIAEIRRLRIARNLATPAVLLSKAVRDKSVDARLRKWDEVLPLLP